MRCVEGHIHIESMFGLRIPRLEFETCAGISELTLLHSRHRQEHTGAESPCLPSPVMLNFTESFFQELPGEKVTQESSVLLQPVTAQTSHITAVTSVRNARFPAGAALTGPGRWGWSSPLHLCQCLTPVRLPPVARGCRPAPHHGALQRPFLQAAPRRPSGCLRPALPVSWAAERLPVLFLPEQAALARKSAGHSAGRSQRMGLRVPPNRTQGNPRRLPSSSSLSFPDQDLKQKGGRRGRCVPLSPNCFISADLRTSNRGPGFRSGLFSSLMSQESS